MSSSPPGKPNPALELSANRCPKNISEVADLYLLDRLTPEQARVFEEHYLQCPTCAKELEQTRSFIDAIRAARALPRPIRQ